MEFHLKKDQLKGVLRPKLPSIPLTSCFLINTDFLLSQVAYFNHNINLPLVCFETLGFMFPKFFVYFKK